MELPPCPRRSGRFNILTLTKLSAIIASLLILASAPSLSVASTTKSTCIEIKEDFDLRNIARTDNVILLVHETDDDSVRKHICNKLESTPKERIAAHTKDRRPTTFAFLEIKEPSYDSSGELQDGGKGFASSLGIKSFPSIAHLSGGMDGTSKYSQHMTYYNTDSSVDDIPSIEKFIQSHVGYHLGNDVYNIIFFDSIASKFVSYGDCSGINRLKQKALALLVKFSTLFSYKEPFSSIGKLYNKAFDMSLKNGVGYANSQIIRIDRVLSGDTGSNNNLTPDSIHQMNQKKAILKSFAEPRVLSWEDERQILIHIFLHVGLVVATILLAVLPSETTNEEGEGEEGEAVNEVPVIARVVEEENGKGGKKKHH